MANRHSTLTSLFRDIANAIRTKTGSTAEILADNFDQAIAAIPKVVNIEDITITADDLLETKIAYNKFGKIVGNIPIKNKNDLICTNNKIIIPKGYYEKDCVILINFLTNTITKE